MLSFLNCIYFNDYCIENLISSDYVWLGLPFLSCSFNQSIPWTFTLWSYLNFYIRSVSFYNSLDIYTFTSIVLLNLHFEHVKSSNEMSVHWVQNYLVNLNNGTTALIPLGKSFILKIIFIQNLLFCCVWIYIKTDKTLIEINISL